MPSRVMRRSRLHKAKNGLVLIVVFGVLIVVLLVKPAGLLGKQIREKV